MHESLTETLRAAQRFGFFGDRPIDEAIEHSNSFVQALGDLPPGSRVIDLGTGGGLPGLVLADSFRDATVVLLDRREKRTDFLRLAVLRLGFDHVEVRCDDVAALIRDVRTEVEPPFDVVTARGFGPPEFTIRSAASLLAPAGRIVISEPPTGDRWPTALLEDLMLTSERTGPVRVFCRSAT